MTPERKRSSSKGVMASPFKVSGKLQQTTFVVIAEAALKSGRLAKWPLPRRAGTSTVSEIPADAKSAIVHGAHSRYTTPSCDVSQDGSISSVLGQIGSIDAQTWTRDLVHLGISTAPCPHS